MQYLELKEEASIRDYFIYYPVYDYVEYSKSESGPPGQ